MHADLVKVEQMIEQPHVPVGGAASADMAQNLRILPRQVLGADRGDGAGAHVGDAAGIEDRLGRAGARIEQGQDGEFGRKAEFVIVDEVADHLHPAESIGSLIARAAR